MKSPVTFDRILILFFLLAAYCNSYAQEVLSTGIPIPIGSPVPVGSGARALGIGGAFIGIADDATAASWNPGGLVQLKRPEISLVGSWVKRQNYYKYESFEKSSQSPDVKKTDFNYISIAYPFDMFNRNMVVSFNYQHLYDFDMDQYDSLTRNTLKVKLHLKRRGALSPYGIAYCIQIVPSLSFGATFNFWQSTNGINTIETTITNHIFYSDTLGNTTQAIIKDRIDGFNANLGARWCPMDNLTIGVVYKTRLNADLSRKAIQQTTSFRAENNSTITTPFEFDAKLRMPESFGFGASYKINDRFKLAADVYQTIWNEYIYVGSDGQKISPITDKPPKESRIDATNQLRMGVEYLIVRPGKQMAIPLRMGAFYDPLPNQNQPTDTYGASFGVGYSTTAFSIDVFYQHKFAKDIEPIDNKQYAYPDKFNEDMMFMSLIFYL